MTEEIVPTSDTPKESSFKRARFGLISFAFFLSSLIIVLIMVYIARGSTGFDAPNVIETRVFWLGLLEWVLVFTTIVGIIFAGIGLKADKAKALTKILLFLWIPGMCYLVYALSLELIILSGHGGSLP